MADEPTEEDRKRLGNLVEIRRLSLQFSIDKAAQLGNMSPVTWSKIERGLPVRALALYGVDKALAWAPGEAARMLRESKPLPRWAPGVEDNDDAWFYAQGLAELDDETGKVRRNYTGGVVGGTPEDAAFVRRQAEIEEITADLHELTEAELLRLAEEAHRELRKRMEERGSIE